MLGGAGGGEIAHLPPGLDVYLTGDIGYHDALAAQLRGLALIDAGHAGTEKGIVPVLVEYLGNELGSLNVVPYAEPDAFDWVTH